jgi:serralysin
MSIITSKLVVDRSILLDKFIDYLWPADPPTGVSQPNTGDNYVDGILSGYKWSHNYIKFNFPTSASYYPAGYSTADEPHNNFGITTAAQQDAVRWALFQNYAKVSNLHFMEVGANDAATISVAQSDDPGTAWGYYPSSNQSGGDVWFNNSSGTYDNPQLGNYAMLTTIHELGHALGLKHGHDTTPANSVLMPGDHDSLEYSVMSYRSYIGDSTSGGYANETWGYPQSLMMQDIAAIQKMYGANYFTNSTDTTYTFSTTTGEMFVNGVGQGAPGANRVFRTVWDGNGNDTYDFSNYSTNLDVDLAPGKSSMLSDAQRAYLGEGHYAGGNLYNALLFGGDTRSLIENARGGTGADEISGNQANNILLGNGGSDRLFGFAGNDQLNGGDGTDMVSGGDGNDRLLGGNGNDTVYGGNGNDTMFGHGGADFMNGQAGNDVITSGTGNDRLYGGTGNDQFVFAPGDGNDIVYDFVAGGASGDTINFNTAALDTFAEILAAAHNVGGNCVIDVNATTHVTLVGVLEAQLTAADFV